MNDFDKITFFQLKTPLEKVYYLNSCIDTEIIIKNLTAQEYNSIHGCYHLGLYLELARKKCSFGLYSVPDMSILNSICGYARNEVDIIIEAFKIYEANKGFTTNEEKAIIHDIFSYSDFVYRRDNKLMEYTLEMYDRLEISINIRDGWLSGNIDTLAKIAKYGRIDYFLAMLKAYKVRNLPIDNNIFIKFIPRMYILKNYRVYTTDLKPIETDEIQILTELIDFCIENGLNIHNKERLDYNWNPLPDSEQSNKSNQLILVLHKLIEETYDWTTIKKVFNYYVENGISLFENGNNPIYLMATIHDVPAIDYMLTYCETDTHGKDYDLNDSEFMRKIISFNSVVVLKYLISRGAKPRDAIYRWDAPCPHCYNGERHKCNFRNITLEYILLARYGIKLAELYNPDILDKLEDADWFDMSWYDCNGNADDDEIYTKPGIDFEDWNNFIGDDNNDTYNSATQQRQYRIPPVVISKEEFTC